MPELPEVETLRRELAHKLVGREIKSVKIFWPKMIAPLTSQVFDWQLKGQRIKSVKRRAKILFLNLSNDATLAIHLKMTGQLIFSKELSLKPAKDSPLKHTRAIFYFTDRTRLYFNDLRKFGWLRLLSPEEKAALTDKHGIEPLSPQFTLKNFIARLQRYPNRQLKQNLLEQTLIAGLGNIYSDESCFAAQVRPNRRVKTLKVDEIKKLHGSIKKILRLAIKKGGASARDYVRSDGRPGEFVPYLKVYGRAKLPCRVCHTPITKIKFAGRGTHFCPWCQQ